jgi:thymidylate synthase
MSGEIRLVGGTIDKLCVRFDLNPWQPYFDYGDAFRTDRDFSCRQLEWYESKNRSVLGSPVEGRGQWAHVKPSKNGLSNSNYGWCVYSPENGDGVKSQFDFAIDSLFENDDSRQAMIFYSGPRMHVDWKTDDMHDFTCTAYTHLFLRRNYPSDNRFLVYLVRQRSCDLFGGFFYDFPHHCEVYKRAFSRLAEKYSMNETYGRIIYDIDTLHVYERDFGKLLKIDGSFKKKNFGDSNNRKSY